MTRIVAGEWAALTDSLLNRNKRQHIGFIFLLQTIVCGNRISILVLQNLAKIILTPPPDQDHFVYTFMEFDILIFGWGDNTSVHITIECALSS